MKMSARKIEILCSTVLLAGCLFAQQIDFLKECKAVVGHYEFVENHRKESMWSALPGAKIMLGVLNPTNLR